MPVFKFRVSDTLVKTWKMEVEAETLEEAEDIARQSNCPEDTAMEYADTEVLQVDDNGNEVYPDDEQ